MYCTLGANSKSTVGNIVSCAASEDRGIRELFGGRLGFNMTRHTFTYCLACRVETSSASGAPQSKLKILFSKTPIKLETSSLKRDSRNVM